MSIKPDRWIRAMSATTCPNCDGHVLPGGKAHGKFCADCGGKPWQPMIAPFEPKQVREVRQMLLDNETVKKVISYGCSSYGYDLRVANEFKIFSPVHCGEVDPKNFDARSFVDVKAGPEGFVRIPANSFALARAVEYFRIPRNVLTVCLGKSTYARSGIIVNVTPFEPGWHGIPTLEISNTTPLPCRVYANEGLAQVLFFESDEPCETSYADRAGGPGKYQGHTEITAPKA